MRKLSITIMFITLIFLQWGLAEGQPKEVLEEIKTLVQKSKELYEAGRYEEAIPYAKKLLEITERELPDYDFGLLKVLNLLADLYQMTGLYVEAERLYKRSLKISEKVLGGDHPDLATSLNTLAMLYLNAGRYTEAEPLFKRSLEIREKALGKDHPNIATSLNNLAVLYNQMRRYSEAETLYKKSLEICEKHLEKDHPELAIILSNLADFYMQNFRFDESEMLYKRSLEIKEKALGRDHPEVAIILDKLAQLYKTNGRYAEAEPLYKRSLEISKKVFGKDSQKVAAILENIAYIYKVTGRYAEAEPLCKRSLEMKERALGKDHADIVASLNNLASLYTTTGRYGEAESLLKRSLQIGEKVLGKDNPEVATILDNLAQLYEITGRYAGAEPLYKRSLEIKERVLGIEHPDVALGLNNIASLYEKTGRDAEAETLYQKSLQISEIALGRDHPNNATILINLALIYIYSERHFAGHQIFHRGIKISEKKRENVFLIFSEKQKLKYMSQTSGDIYAFIALTVNNLQTRSDAVMDSFDAWLNWKGTVMEAQERYLNAVMHLENPEINKKFEDLIFIREAIARLQISGPGKMEIEEYKKRLDELDKKKGSLEVELNRLSKDFALERLVGRADTKNISEVLLKKGNDSVYIDFANINIYDFKEKKWSRPRYLVFVLLPDKEPVVKLTDLSDTGEVDKHIKSYLEEMKRAKEYGEVPRERILKAEAKALYDILLKPIEADIKGKKLLYISPDGNLNLIPFEVLMTPEGKYLMEDYTITYVGAGRDIMRFMDETVAKGDGFIMADPDYDLGLQEKAQVAKAMGVIETRGPSPTTRDAKDLRFKRLPDTKKEADVIEKCLREGQKMNVRNYQDKKALEEVLFTTKNPRILHLATHGYFLKDEEVKHQPQLGFLFQERERVVDIGIENPMLRSGIVLAGANASLKEGRDDGIVSAEKILGLRLKGTDLVVLSACDTGTGEVKSGEGVFGLKRSFILSGAKTVVMSLWAIPSKETTELMTEFYTLMAKGKTKAEALREARLNLMKKKPNPFYWGAFLMVGNPN